jgi:hypothetical protein
MHGPLNVKFGIISIQTLIEQLSNVINKNTLYNFPYYAQNRIKIQSSLKH